MIGSHSGISLPCYLQNFFLDRIDRSSFSLLEECLQEKEVLTVLPNCLVRLLFLVARYLVTCHFPYTDMTMEKCASLVEMFHVVFLYWAT